MTYYIVSILRWFILLEKIGTNQRISTGTYVWDRQSVYSSILKLRSLLIFIIFFNSIVLPLSFLSDILGTGSK